MASEKRLIDANLMWRYAWNELQKANKRHEGEPDFKAWSSGIAELIAALAKDMPTVDAVEVVHGYWYKAPHHPYRCSCCGEMALLDMYGESHFRSNYCPNCGAKMDGDGNG